jgi:phosphotransferase system  glucose/maltose/N-acetylglucosamine-specific IIC component
MKRKLKMLPVIFMLLAGAVTSIITYSLQYEGKTALFVLLVVLLLFYILGFFFRNMIWRFEDEVNNKEKESMEEGKVLEKSADTTSENDKEDGVKGTGEQ